MKTVRFAMTAAALILCSAVKADQQPTAGQAPAPGSAQTQVNSPAPAPASAAPATNTKAPQLDPADAAKLAELQAEKAELVRKIALKRTELLKNDPKLHRMHIQLLKQIRALALEMDSNREMRELNDALSEVEKKMKKISDK